MLWRLFHIEEGLENNARAIKAKNRALQELRDKRTECDTELDSARADQARARTSVIQQEKKIKKAETALEAKVFNSIRHAEAD